MSPELQPEARNTLFDRQTGENPIFPNSLYPFFLTKTIYFWRCVIHGGPYELIPEIDLTSKSVLPGSNTGNFWYPCGCSRYGGVGITWNQPARSHLTPQELTEDDQALPDHATFMKPYYQEKL